jgi:hypothetical protein
MQNRLWNYGPARAEAWGNCGLSVFRTHGVVQPGTIGNILASCQGAVGDWGSAGLVADYRNAYMRIDAEALLQSALHVVHEGGALALPTALVVKHDEVPMLKLYAHLMARNGILRGVFTDPDAALCWVRRQAAVWEADRCRQTPESAR